MDQVSREDISFLDKFLEDELTEEGLMELDEKLKNPKFKAYYEARLEEKYQTTLSRLLVSYLPMILLFILLIIGIYLIINE